MTLGAGGDAPDGEWWRVAYWQPASRGVQHRLSGWRLRKHEILTDFPDLGREDIRAAIAFAADRERRLMGPTA